MTIHPFEWSVNGLIKSFRYGRKMKGSVMRNEDVLAYGLLPAKDKVVLDLGAYIGDSALLFFRNGAKKVICVECNRIYCINLKRNLKSLNYELREKKADKADLLANDYDVIKCDIEGYESGLLDYFRKPTVLEYHSAYLKEELEKRGFRVTHVFSSDSAGICEGLMKNF